MLSEIYLAKEIQKKADMLEEAAEDKNTEEMEIELIAHDISISGELLSAKLELISEQLGLAALLLESAEKLEDPDLLKRIIVAVSRIFGRINE
jgi:hypothetical protein